MRTSERSTEQGVGPRVWPRAVQKHWQAACNRVQELERPNALPQSVRPQGPNKTGTAEEVKAVGTSLDSEAQRIAHKEEKERVQAWKTWAKETWTQRP